MDWYVLLLSPIVVFALVLLLGFAGCQELFGLQGVTGTTYMTFQVRVPANLTVISQRFAWTRPNGTTQERWDMPVRTDEVGTFLLSWTIEDVVAGSWSVTCRIEARDASAQAMTSATADFILMMPAEWSTSTVLFETTGQPSTMFGMNVSMVPV